MKRTLAALISSKVVAVVAIVFLIAMSAVTVTSHVMISKEARIGAANMLESVNGDIEKRLGLVEMVAQGNSWVVGDGFDNDGFMYYVTSQSVMCNPNVLGCAVAFLPDEAHPQGHAPYAYRDEAGKIQTKDLNDHPYTEEDWFKTAMADGAPYWSEPYYDGGGAGQMMCTYSYPIKDTLGTIRGVVTADIALDWIEDMVRNVAPYENSYMVLSSRKGKLLSMASDSAAFAGNVLDNARHAKDRRVVDASEKMLAGETGYAVIKGKKGLSVMLYSPLENGWSSAMVVRYRDVLKGCSVMHWFMVVVGLLGLLSIYILCRRVIKRLANPLNHFANSAREISKGDFDVKLPDVANCSEMLTLHESMDQMQRSLKHYIADLQTTTQANARIESELNMARNIQLGMVPHDFPQGKSYDIYALLHPAREVGGDFYDFAETDGKLYFAVGDVSGKGMPAALVMAITKAAFRFFAGMGMPVEEILYHINHTVSDGNESMMFVTLFAGCLDLATGEMTYCNGGHNPILVTPIEGGSRYLDEKPNVAVGVMDGFRYAKETLQLHKGDGLLLYTDGVTEAERADKNQYGEEALLKLADTPRFRESQSRQRVELLSEDVKTFVDGNEQNDDITIMSIVLK